MKIVKEYPYYYCQILVRRNRGSVYALTYIHYVL